MRVLDCGLHGFHETIGIDSEELRVYWRLSSDVEDDVQTAYQVILSSADVEAESASSLDARTAVWNSGKVDGAQQRNVLVKPEDGLKSTTFYYWQVTVWDRDGRPHRSAINAFFTAYPRSHLLPPYSMNQTYMPHSSLIFRTWFENEHDRWKAVWIGNGSDKPLYLRKSFDIASKPKKVIALASGLGHFNLTVNGSPASNHVLDPGWTNYHRTVQYVGYDVTDLVASGSNAIGAHVGNGFYAGDQGDRFFWPMYEDNTYVRYGNELCFFAEIHVFNADGSHDVIVSDPSWQVRESATILANIYASETHDKRLIPHGWDTSAFDASRWAAAKPLTGPRGFLKYQSQPPVVLHETFEPVAKRTPRHGTVCFDLGQNASTIVKIVVEGEAGSEVTVRYAETANEDGTVLMPDPLFKEFETKVYSTIYLAGTGSPEMWQPDFCFTSARYIQVEGVALEAGQGLPVVHSVVGQHVSSAARSLGHVQTDKDDCNALINACKWTFSSNLFSYHTDCPQIEKFGWLEVTHLLAPATQYARDMEDLYTKILDDICDAQEPNGIVPTMAPEMRYMCGPLHDTITWGCAVCFLPDILKRYYGSTHVIKKVYPQARRYMEYIKTNERKGGLIEHGLGDWGRDIAFGNHQALIETAVYFKCLKCCEMMAEELGIKSDAQYFAGEAETIRTVYNKHLLVTDDPDRQGAYYTSLDNYPSRDCTAIGQAVPLQFGLVPEEHVSAVQRNFLTTVADGKMRAGEIGLPFLFNTLGDLKRPDIVLQMARQEEHPSYMRFLRRGETTLLEFWQDACRSKCHDMLGTIYEWFYAHVLGLRPVEEAYRRFVVDPPWESEFGEVDGVVVCPYGKIEIRWKCSLGSGDGRDFEMEIEVPFGTTAEVRLPSELNGIHITREGGKAGTASRETVKLSHGRHRLSLR